jgi:hypothetical protein
VVHEVSKCFIDLGLNEEDEDYAAGQLQAKQERFEEALAKLPFVFEGESLKMPTQS